MSRLFSASEIASISTNLFVAAGAGERESRIATESLITSSLMGHDSHGVMRIPEYLGCLADGSIKTQGAITIDRTSPTTAVVDCGQGFGAVGARHAIEAGVAISREQKTACIITRRCNHVGRLGAYVQQAADCRWNSLISDHANLGKVALAIRLRGNAHAIRHRVRELSQGFLEPPGTVARRRPGFPGTEFG